MPSLQYCNFVGNPGNVDLKLSYVSFGNPNPNPNPPQCPTVGMADPASGEPVPCGRC